MGRIVGIMLLGAVAGIVGDRVWQRLTADPADYVSPEDEENAPTDLVSMSVERQGSAGIQVEVISPRPMMTRLWRSGRVALHEDRIAHISPPSDGIVREVPVRLGQTVKAGDLLAVIESRELGQAKLDAYKARLVLAAERDLLDRTRTTMANASELLDLLEAGAPVAEIERRLTGRPIGEIRQQLLESYTRRNQLRAQLASQKASGGALAETTVLKTAADLDMASAAYTAMLEELRFQVRNLVRQAEFKLRDAETAYDVARARLVLFGIEDKAVDQLDPIAEGARASWLGVKAPFAGTIVEKHAVLSERVGPQFQMFVLADLSTVWLQADVFEADLPLLHGLAGKPIRFRSPLARISERDAKVVYAGDLVDRSSRSVTLTAEAANPDRELKPGLFIEVAFQTGGEEPVLQVPLAAILRHENEPFVFVRESEDEFRRVSVKLGRSNEDHVEIRSGLSAGAAVVVRGGFILKSELFKDHMVGE